MRIRVRNPFQVVKIIIDGELPVNCGKCQFAMRSPFPEYSNGCTVMNLAVRLAEELEGRPNWCPLTDNFMTLEQFEDTLELESEE